MRDHTHSAPAFHAMALVAAARAALAAARAEARVSITPAPEVRVQAGLPELADGGRVGLRMPWPSPGEAETRGRLHRAQVALARFRINAPDRPDRSYGGFTLVCYQS